MPPVFFLVIVLAVFAAGLVVAGVFMLAGLAWALIASGVFVFAAATFLFRGITNV